MNLLNRYKTVAVVVIPILILVLIRSLSINSFRNDAKKWAEPSFKRSNILGREEIMTLSGEILIINLNGENSGINETTAEEINIPPESVLSKNHLSTIRRHYGPVFLFSSESAVSARIWMILSQMGFRNIYILTNSTDNEVFKNKFRPDTISRPEL